MIALLQTIATVGLGALLAGQVAVTRTGRLRRAIAANLDLLDRLSADNPHRAALEAHNGELLAVLARRQRSRFGPFVQAGVSFGAVTVTAFYALMMAAVAALLAAGIVPADPDPTSEPTPGDRWAVVWFLGLVAAGLIGWAVWIARRQFREHPPPPLPTEAPQPTETGEDGQVTPARPVAAPKGAQRRWHGLTPGAGRPRGDSG
jgi:hypothetical protein